MAVDSIKSHLLWCMTRNLEPLRPTCSYYARGACKYGKKCRFLHLKPSASGGETRTADNGTTSNAGKHRNADCSTSEWSGPANVCAAQKTAGSSIESSSSEHRVNAPEGSIFSPSAESEAEEKAEATSQNCDVSGAALCLDPSEETEEEPQASGCIKKPEKKVDVSLAIQRSKDKTCGICHEVIMEKVPEENKFGILLNCNHCFCLMCISKWRKAKIFNSKIKRSCPVCLANSDFVCPSSYWVEDREDKENLISDYKSALSTKHCRFFSRGLGTCLRGSKCLYLHTYPNGTKTDVSPPVSKPPQISEGGKELIEKIVMAYRMEFSPLGKFRSKSDDEEDDGICHIDHCDSLEDLSEMNEFECRHDDLSD